MAATALVPARARLRALCQQLTDASVELPASLTLGMHEVPRVSGKLGLLLESNDLLGRPEELRRRLQRDGYLYIRELIPRARVDAAYRKAVEVLQAEGSWPWGKFSTEWANCPEVMDHIAAPELQSLFRALFDEPEVVSLRFKWIRTMPPPGAEIDKPYSQFHCDNVYMNRGTDRILSSWLPMQDVDFALGGLAVCEKSHALPGFARMRETYAKHDFMDLPGVQSNGGNLTPDPHEVLAMDPAARLLTSAFAAGDALIFTMYTLHGSVQNTSDRVRLSADVRWQPAGDKMDPRYTVESTTYQKAHYMCNRTAQGGVQDTSDSVRLSADVVGGDDVSVAGPDVISWQEQKRRWGLVRAGDA